MSEHPGPEFRPRLANGSHRDGDLSDLLGELRILLPGAQLLTAFLITLPFSSGFSKIQQAERWIFWATFMCSLSSLVFLSAPAISAPPDAALRDRERFKRFTTRMIIIGVVLLSFALILAVELIVSEVFRSLVANVMAVGVLLLIGVVWWLLPHYRKTRIKA